MRRFVFPTLLTCVFLFCSTAAYGQDTGLSTVADEQSSLLRGAQDAAGNALLPSEHSASNLSKNTKIATSHDIREAMLDVSVEGPTSVDGLDEKGRRNLLYAASGTLIAGGIVAAIILLTGDDDDGNGGTGIPGPIGRPPSQ